MLPLHFGYLILVIVGMVFWSIFFILRKDLRKQMIHVGILFGILSLITAQVWWTIDWWHPLTITGTGIGVEDFVTGFGAGGVMTVIYQVFFKKKLIGRSTNQSSAVRGTLPILVLVSIHILFVFLGFTSFKAYTLVLVLGTLCMWLMRKDLIIPSIWSGILTTICILPLYWVTILLVPGWVMATYEFSVLSGLLFTGIPVEELVFWIVTGAFVGVLLPFIRSTRFVNLSKIKKNYAQQKTL